MSSEGTNKAIVNIFDMWKVSGTLQVKECRATNFLDNSLIFGKNVSYVLLFSSLNFYIKHIAFCYKWHVWSDSLDNYANVPQTATAYCSVLGVSSSAAGWFTALQARRSRVCFPIRSLRVFISIILQTAQWLQDRLSL